MHYLRLINKGGFVIIFYLEKSLFIYIFYVGYFDLFLSRFVYSIFIFLLLLNLIKRTEKYTIF